MILYEKKMPSNYNLLYIPHRRFIFDILKSTNLNLEDTPLNQLCATIQENYTGENNPFLCLAANSTMFAHMTDEDWSKLNFQKKDILQLGMPVVTEEFTNYTTESHLTPDALYHLKKKVKDTLLTPENFMVVLIMKVVFNYLA